MSKKPKTHVVIVLDRSGSMASIRSQALQNYNEQIQQMKENAKDQDIFASLITFNGEVYEHLWDQPVDSLEEADESAYVPSGGTAMYDAIGYAIKKLKSTVEDDENTAYLITVISDGEENASKHFGLPASLHEADLKVFAASGRGDLKVLIESVQATKKWTFAYMGCNERYLYQVARSTGIPISNMAAFSTDSAKSAEFGFSESRERLTRNYYKARSGGKVATSCLYSNDASSCADFTKVSDEPSLPNYDVNIEPSLPSLDVSIDPNSNISLADYSSNALAAMKSYFDIPVRQSPFGTGPNSPTVKKAYRRAAFESKPVEWKA